MKDDSNISVQDFKQITGFLEKVINNIVENPNNPKYSQIKNVF
jgi:hypothetical protein